MRSGAPGERVELLETTKDHSDDALDLAASSVTLGRYCEPYELVFSNMPDIADGLIPDVLRVLARTMDVKFTLNCVVGIRRPNPPRTFAEVTDDVPTVSGTLASEIFSQHRCG